MDIVTACNWLYAGAWAIGILCLGSAWKQSKGDIDGYR